jgi:hypothetical protein
MESACGVEEKNGVDREGDYFFAIFIHAGIDT